MRRTPVILAVVAITVTGVGMLVLRPGSSSYRHTSPNTYRAPTPTPSADAFEHGGMPLHDKALETYLVDVEHDLARGGRALDRSPAPIVALGAPVAEAWQLFADTVAAGSEDELREDVRALNERMIAARAGYQLELRFVRRNDVRDFGVIIHRVDDVAFVRVDSARRRVLGLRRADGTIVAKGALGVETPELGPVVMLDPIASYTISDVLPVLAPNAAFDIGSARLGPQVGAAVRAELAAALGPDAAAASRVAALVAERNDIVHHKWKSVRINEPLGLFLADRLLAAADDEPARARVDAIEAELDTLAAARIAARLEAFVVQSTRRHEAEHLVDLERVQPLRYPPALEAIAGAALDEAGEPRRIVTFARAELAAYLAQIINDPLTPHLTLWGVVMFAYKSPRGAAGQAGRVIVDGIAKHLGSTDAVPACAGATGEQLRTAPRALWTELYGEPPLAITD